MLEIKEVKTKKEIRDFINFPLNLAKVVLKMGIVQKQLNAKVGENVNLDIEEILALIDSEVMGDLMTIDTKDAKIRIWID